MSGYHDQLFRKIDLRPFRRGQLARIQRPGDVKKRITPENDSNEILTQALMFGPLL